jgi:RHS repeat-associated protein
MPNRSFSSSSYRYGFNGQEKDDEVKGEGNSLDFGARINDPRIGKWLSVDPWASRYPWQSPYVSMDNTPIVKIDPTGNGTESTHIDEKGKVIKQYDDGDNSVYVHKNGTSEHDVNKQYVESMKKKSTSAGGEKIGELGKTLDVEKILTNVLVENRKVASESNEIDWVLKVKGGGEWDLKSNKNTIFGVAWDYDMKQKDKTGSEETTNFTYHGFSYDKKFNAADVGNYHAGYMGTIVGIPPLIQKIGAGYIEKIKQGVFIKTMLFTNDFMSAPFGDPKADYYWNTKGMHDAKYSEIYNAEHFQ